MSGKSIVIEQKLLLLGYEVNRSVLLAENEKIRTILAKLEKFFFFRAEDGIRDGHVNGVQTCALPIFDSSEMSFKIAGSLALQNCVKEAGPFLLEPIMTLEVLVPEEQMGDVLADLNSRRGRVLGMEATGAGLQRIKAHVPMAETFRYATDL